MYNHREIEKKWQKRWEKEGIYRTGKDSKKPKYYILDMFPYPSGAGLHMGHTESYTASDIIYRFKTMQGYNVLHPQGFDSFGLPAENYAIKTGTHPKETISMNAKNYIEQMKMLGLGHDLNHLIYTSDSSYYKWTQFLFGKFFENNLVEKKVDIINWCPSCNTGIANEQVENGECERCGAKIEQKEIPGWFFKITDFADELIEGLDKVDWPEHTKKNQKAWIGKSEGAKIVFNVKSQKSKVISTLEVFTTRPDTLFGATYMVVAPEHPLIKILSTCHPREGGDPENCIKNYNEVEAYIEKTKKKTELERMEGKEKTGVELKGIKAINPANDEEIPIFVADYVLANYGTGAIMAVPAHDERDFEFAKKFEIEIRKVIIDNTVIARSRSDVAISSSNNKTKLMESPHSIHDDKLFTGNGVLTNSDKFNGLSSEEAKEKITKFVNGKLTSNYRLRDWSISRQRYWGCPIPIVYSPKGKAEFVGKENLPWLLPEDVNFVPDGTAPLAKSKELKERTEKLFGKGWTPEVDTMDTFVDSSWYFLRYPDTENNDEFCNNKKLKNWFPINLYIGGEEHTYMHLLYARFFIKAMNKIGLIDFNEPFQKLRHQGMVLDSKGMKMSKSKGNVINPDDIVGKFGADATRLYMMFVGPLEDKAMFKEEGVTGTYRFLEKVWRLATDKDLIDCGGKCTEVLEELPSLLHKTIKKVGNDIEKLHFNTAISQMMILVNTMNKYDSLPKAMIEKLLMLLAPFAPHIAEELWSELGHKKSIFKQKWPEYNPKFIKDTKIELIVQVNGKVRARIETNSDISENDAKNLATKNEKVGKWIEGKKIVKVIFVKGKLLNIVVK